MLCSYDLGVAYFHRGNMPESIRAFRRCLELDAHYNAAHSGGDRLRRAGGAGGHVCDRGHRPRQA